MDSLEDIWADPENVRIEVPDNVFEQPDADGEYECEAGDFETVEVFGSFEELTEWAQRTTMDLDYVLVIRRTNKNSKEVVNKVTLICHHGGGRDARLIGPSKRSSKIGCPFTLIGRLGRDGGWRLTVKDWRHNHDPTTSLQGNAYAHFVAVKLAGEYPMAYKNPEWEFHATDPALRLALTYANQEDAYQNWLYANIPRVPPGPPIVIND